MISDVKDDPNRTLNWFMCCPCCRLADTWHGAGQLPYHFGILLTQLLFPFLPCVGAYFRGAIRGRFSIRASRLSDLVTWLLCMPLAASQEAKHIDMLCAIASEEQETMRRDELRKQAEAHSHSSHHREHKAEPEAGKPSKIGRESEVVKEKPSTRPSQTSIRAAPRPSVGRKSTVLELVNKV